LDARRFLFALLFFVCPLSLDKPWEQSADPIYLIHLKMTDGFAFIRPPRENPRGCFFDALIENAIKVSFLTLREKHRSAR